jgi:DNA-binding NarL/FixJ family response regulator
MGPSRTPLSNPLVRVLIVDESQVFRDELQSLLRKLGHEAFGQATLRAALEEIQTRPLDVVIVDLGINATLGFEFIRHVRNGLGSACLPILVLTNPADPERMLEAARFGADAYCAKDVICDTIESYLILLRRLGAGLRENEANAHGRQTTAEQLGAYKHELGNSLMILDGTMQRLLRKNSILQNDPTALQILKSMETLQGTVQKINALCLNLEGSYGRGHQKQI